MNRFGRQNQDYESIEAPIKEELLSSEKLMEVARIEAHMDRISSAGNKDVYKKITDDLKRQEAFLDQAYKEFEEGVISNKDLVPSTAEWLLDNYYIVKNQFNLIKGDLSKKFFDELPKLRSNEYKYYPRVYKIAWKITGHTDSRINKAVLTEYLKSYQRISPLSSGEIWALPIMMRLTMLDNLTRLINESVTILEKRTRTAQKAAELVQLWQEDQNDTRRLIRRMEKNETEFDLIYWVYIADSLRKTLPFVPELVSLVEGTLTKKKYQQR